VRGEGKGEAQSARQDVELVQSQIAAAAAGRIALGEMAADLIRAHARLAAPGLVTLDRAFAQAGNKDAAVYALRILLAVLGGKEQLPDLARSVALFDHLGQTGRRATLSRAVVDVRPAGIFLYRERRDLPQPVTLSKVIAWDGRYRFECGGEAGQMLVAPFGEENVQQAELPSTNAPESLVRAALACRPAVYSFEGSAYHPMPRLLPMETGRRRAAGTSASPSSGPSRRESKGLAVTASPILGPWARFLPSFDLAPARAVATLLGAQEPPEPPFAGHNARKG
jgi:tRNA(Ile)-lysidine synthase